MRRRSISSSKVSLSSARPPGRWAAPVFLVALFMAAMCAPATADTGYSKGVFSPSACNGAGEFTCTSPYAVQTGWSGDPRTNEGICTTGTCYRTTTGTYTTGSATFEPNLLYSGWYKLQTCWGGSSGASQLAVHTIYYKNGNVAQTVDQSINGDTWVWLQSGNAFQFDAGVSDSCKVVQTHPTAEATGRRVIADNVMWRWVKPNMPTGLLGTAASTTEIDLSWTAASMPADGYYRIERKTGAGGTYAEIAAHATRTTYPDTAVSPDTQYHYRIRAHETGDSDYSAEVASFSDPSAVLLTVVATPSQGGTCNGGGMYAPGALVTLTTAHSTGWSFIKWSTQPDGSDTVQLPYTMPSTPVTLYAIFGVAQFNLTLTPVPAAAGTLTGGGSKAYNSSVAIDAAANPGFYFMGWSTTADDSALITRKHSYTYTMPTTEGDVALYAIYAKAIFFEGFEGLANGSLVMNYSPGNPATNGDLNSGNPWMGYAPEDSIVEARNCPQRSQRARYCQWRMVQLLPGSEPRLPMQWWQCPNWQLQHGLVLLRFQGYRCRQHLHRLRRHSPV